MKNNLTEKNYWNANWKKLNLPAKFFNDYSHKISYEKIGKYIVGYNYKSFLEIGGCPGRWADFFSKKYNLVCDSVDYDEDNNKITEENYKLLKIKGSIFCKDISLNNYRAEKKYDIVLSDGLLEHFGNSDVIFDNHVKHLSEGGLLIMAVPNIKESWFYHIFSKHNKENYSGFRHIDKFELVDHARRNNLDILYCDYLGVFNIGLVNFKKKSYVKNKFITAIYLISSFLLEKNKIRRETNTFSPYIYLFARKKQ